MWMVHWKTLTYKTKFNQYSFAGQNTSLEEKEMSGHAGPFTIIEMAEQCAVNLAKGSSVTEINIIKTVEKPENPFRKIEIKKENKNEIVK